MQKISDSTNTANAAGEFTEGNPAAGAAATLIKASWLNTIQRELCGLVLGAGISLNATDDAQVLKAVKALQFGMGSTTGGTVVTDAEVLTSTSIVRVGPTWVGSPYTGPNSVNQGSLFHRSAFDGTSYQVQMFQSMTADVISFRRKTNGTWQDPVFAWHTGNLGQATTNVAGIVPIATTAQVDAGTNAGAAVTPLTLAGRLAAVLVGATTGVAGLIKLATGAMVDAGTDNNSVVTPLTLAGRLGAVLVGATTETAGLIKLATRAMVDAGTDNNSVVTPLTLAGRLGAVLVGATTEVAGFIKLATQAMVDTGADNNSAVTPMTLKKRLADLWVSASTSVSGVLKLSTQAQVDAGTDSSTAVTPQTLSTRLGTLIVSATTTASGILKLATQVMVNAGTDNNSAVTPLTLANKLAAVVVGATESVAGVIRVATSDIMAAGTDNSAAVTVSKLRLGFAFLTATNGFIAFPGWLGGFVMQWGTNSHTVNGTQTVSLPMAFPRGVFGAFGGTVAAVAPQGTGFGATFTTVSTYSAAGYNVFWLALGY
ncbi:hypothetical protein DXU77_20880 [Pseudomonas lactis]|uniref:gp53-like domain-containing protein n=1 Tax=Pseudomonas lactis TaxID=1615674 RepID=UPI0012956570|nr:hypothetical protein [Pseudomonas lactis]MQB17502.1 hypothetical protein [Pseudomonas lactis]